MVSPIVDVILESHLDEKRLTGHLKRFQKAFRQTRCRAGVGECFHHFNLFIAYINLINEVMLKFTSWIKKTSKKSLLESHTLQV